jgi:hypothetical protein
LRYARSLLFHVYVLEELAIVAIAKAAITAVRDLLEKNEWEAPMYVYARHASAFIPIGYPEKGRENAEKVQI